MTKAAESIEITLPDEVPPGWRRTTLGEIGEYINGRGFKKSEWAEQGLPIIRIQNLTGTGKEQNYYDGEIDERNVVNPGDLLISWAATLGAYLWAGPRAALNQHIFKVRSFVDKKFHYYLMQHILGDLYRQTHGSGMVHITKSKFDSMPIVVPETEYQQKRIVAEIEKQFSRLDEAVANLKRVKANLKRYKATVLKTAVEGRLIETEAEVARREGRSYETGEQLLQRILETRRSQWQGKGKYKEPAAPDTADQPKLPEGWVWTSIESIAFVTKLAGFEYTKFVKYSPDGDLAVIKAENAGPSGFKRTDFSCVKSSTVSQLTRSQLKSGDLLMVFVGAGTGQVARVPDDQPYFLGPNIAMIRVESSEISAPYMEMFLRSPIGNSLALGFAKAVAQPSLSMGTIRMIPIAIPVLSEQHLIVAEVERRFSILRETEAQVDANLRRAERLRQAILSNAFTGNM